jgi:type I restriction enzyme S subunit
VKAGWDIKPLGKLCEFQRGLTYSKTDEVADSKNIVLRANNVDLETNTLDLSDLRFIADTVHVPEGKKVRQGSLLICTASGSKSHLGKVAFVDDDYGYAFGGFMGQITPNADVDGHFLFYAMTSPAYKDFIAQLSDGANINNLKFNDLQNFQVAVPSIAEQHRIVTLLDEAFADIATAKANAEKNLQNARDFFAGQLQDVFDAGIDNWNSSTLGLVYDVRDGTHDSPKYHDEGFPLITSKNLKNEGLTFDDVKLISLEDYNKINERSAVHQGDVLLAMIGTIGNPTVVETIPNFAIKNVALLKVPENQNSYFLRYYLSCPSVITKMQAEAKGTTQKFVGLGYLRAFPISVPDLSEQDQMVSRLDELRAETNRLEAIYRQKITALDDLKKSLLHQAFSGFL